MVGVNDVSKTNELIAEAREFLASENAQYYDSSLIKSLADALEAATRVPVQGEPDDDRTPEFEAIEQELFKHQPLLSMQDGSIRGCKCMDRVFVTKTEDWGTHLAEVFTRLSRATVPDAATEIARSLARASTITGADAEVIAGASMKLAALGEIAELHALCDDRLWSVEKHAERMEAERDAALAAVARVRAIHAPGKIIDVWGKSRSQADDFLVCVECTDPDNWWIAHPCATVAALDGAPEPEVKP